MIEVEGLTRKFGSKTAVRDLSFRVERGQVMGLLGPNGAGKSTTMRMLTGYVRPTAGRATLCGVDVWAKPLAAKRNLGYLPESAPSFDDLTVEEFLKFLAGIRGLFGKAGRASVDRVLDLCFLHSVRRQSIDTLSKGYRHRVCLAQSLLHDPQVIVFDEPTDGLDPNQKKEIRELIARMRPEKAILFSTHILEEVEAVCTDTVLIDKGEIVTTGTPDELKGRARGAGDLRLKIAGFSSEETLSFLVDHGVTGAQIDKEGRAIIPAGGISAEKLGAALVSDGLVPLEIGKTSGDLASVFYQLTSRDSQPSS